MPVFARSDVMCVTVSRAHGGCGEIHRRPFIGDTAAKSWQLDCPQCQGHLTNDPLWSGNLGSVPATPDEDRAVETSNVLFTRNRDDIMTMALARLAGLPAGDLLHAIPGQSGGHSLVRCPDGHDNFPGVKFCGECGTRIAVSSDGISVITDVPAEKTARQQRQPRQSQPRQQPQPRQDAPTPSSSASLAKMMLDVPSI